MLEGSFCSCKTYSGSRASKDMLDSRGVLAKKSRCAAAAKSEVHQLGGTLGVREEGPTMGREGSPARES